MRIGGVYTFPPMDRVVFGRPCAEVLVEPDLDAADAFASFTRSLGLPGRLAEVGVDETQFQLIGEKTMKEFFAFSNPRPLTQPSSVIDILRMAA